MAIYQTILVKLNFRKTFSFDILLSSVGRRKGHCKAIKATIKDAARSTKLTSFVFQEKL
jgi:hypothetical protein